MIRPVAVAALILPLLLLLPARGDDPTCAGHDAADGPRSSSSSSAPIAPEYLIVGAGGSGLQTALLLREHGHSYAILEKSDQVGDFWTRFPRFDELISVNKSVRNQTQRYRYDWHSFLLSDLAMLDVTDEYFPRGRDWHAYMVRAADLNVEFGVEVASLATDGTPCVRLVTGETRCATRRVFVGTGLIEKQEPILEAMGGIPYSRSTRDQARNRRVCILGNGNSGHEAAQNMVPVADRVTLYGRGPTRLSAVTRYTGDVRVKYLQATENLHAKLLDTVDYFVTTPRIQGLEKSPMNERQIEYTKEMVRYASWLDQFECEAFFYATGFLSNVPGLDLGQGDPVIGGRRFPPTDDWYAWEDNPSVHFVGWLMHERDFRRGAGGFLSGYRYLIRNLIHRVREVDHGIPYPHLVLTKEEVARRVVERVEIADDLIILQDGVVLRDAIIPIRGNEDGVSPSDVGKYLYYDGISYEFHPKIARRDDVIYLYFRWGDGRTAAHVFDTNFRYEDTQTLINLFLHPAIEVGANGSLVRELHEDLEMAWKDPAYIEVIDRTIRDALDGRLALFAPKAEHPYQRITFNQTERGYYEPAPLKAGIDPAVFQALWKAVYRMGREREWNTLKAAVKAWMPALFEHEDPSVMQGIIV